MGVDVLKKWLDILFDHKTSLRERMFRLVTGICMIALIFILILGRFTANVFIMAGSIAFMYIAMKISIEKECINMLSLYAKNGGFFFAKDHFQRQFLQ